MSDRTYKYDVSVTVDPEVWQAATGCRAEPEIQQLIINLLRGNGLVVDVDVRLRELPVGPPKFEEIE